MKAKKTGAKSAVIDDTWFKYWVEYPFVRFNRDFGAGGKNFRNSSNKPGVMKLDPRMDAGRRLIGFTVRIPHSGDLPISWDGVTLAPVSGAIPRPLGTIKPYVPGNTQSEMEYANAFKFLVDDLSAAETNYQHLEGLFPVYEQDSFNVDRVRIVNVEKIVDGASDYAIAVLTLISSDSLGPKQNGGGSGPPKKP